MKAIIAVIMMLASAAAHGQVLKCVSNDGKVEYANQCPPGTIEQRTTIFSKGAGAAPSRAPQSKSLAEQDAAFKKRLTEKEEERQKEEKKVAETAQKRYACDSARAYLKALQDGQRITRTDPKTGERIYLEDAEYPKEVARAQLAVDQNCQ